MWLGDKPTDPYVIYIVSMLQVGVEENITTNKSIESSSGGGLCFNCSATERAIPLFTQYHRQN